MLDSIQNWIVGVALVSLAVPLVVKAAKAYLNRNLKRVLDKSLTLDEVRDPVLRAKLLRVSDALVDLTEYVTPDRGTGQEKFAKVDAVLAQVELLNKNAGLRKALIEGACELLWSADDVMKNELKEHRPPSAPPAGPEGPAA